MSDENPRETGLKQGLRFAFIRIEIRYTMETKWLEVRRIVKFIKFNRHCCRTVLKIAVLYAFKKKNGFFSE
jgi:hypothetical protein